MCALDMGRTEEATSKGWMTLTNPRLLHHFERHTRVTHAEASDKAEKRRTFSSPWKALSRWTPCCNFQILFRSGLVLYRWKQVSQFLPMGLPSISPPETPRYANVLLYLNSKALVYRISPADFIKIVQRCVYSGRDDCTTSEGFRRNKLAVEPTRLVVDQERKWTNRLDQLIDKHTHGVQTLTIQCTIIYVPMYDECRSATHAEKVTSIMHPSMHTGGQASGKW